MPASIEFLNELSDRLTKAAAANASTPNRRGCTIHLNAGNADAVVLAGDLHGNRDNFNNIVRAARLDKHPKRHLVLQEVVHGGGAYPNGGCMSHMLLEDVARLKLEFPDRVHFLLSNHELAECTGQQLTKSGVSQNMLFANGLEYAYGPASKVIAGLLHKFILSCPLAVRLANGVLITHSLPDKAHLPKFDPGVFDKSLTKSDFVHGESGYAVVWGRDYDESHVKKYLDKVGAKIVLTGHEPVPEGFRLASRYQLVLDCSGANCYACVAPVAREYDAAELASKLHKL